MNPQKMGQFPAFGENIFLFCLTGKKRLLFDANHLLGMGKFVQKSRKELKVFFQPSDAGVLLHTESKHKILLKNSAFTVFLLNYK